MESLERLREFVGKGSRTQITTLPPIDMVTLDLRELTKLIDEIEEEFKEQEQAHAFAYSQVYDFANGIYGQLLDFDKMDEQQEAMAEHGWVKLPVDAEDEVIHVGDNIDRGDARGHVIALMLSNFPKCFGGGLHWSIQLEGEQAPTALDLTFHHYHETIEDVLREFADAISETHPMDVPACIAKYAQRLRLAGDE